MSNQGKSTLQLPLKTSLYDANDAFVFVYGYDTANSANTNVAQTAVISSANYVQAANLVFLPGPLQTLNFSFTAAQIANCYSAPVTVLAAQGANTLIMPITMLAIASAGTPWTFSGTAGLLSGANFVDDNVLQYTLGGNNAIGFSSAAYVFANNVTGLVNQPLTFTSTVGNPTGGNTSVTVSMQYIVLENLP